MGMEEDYEEVLIMSCCSDLLGIGFGSLKGCGTAAVLLSRCSHHPVLAGGSLGEVGPSILLLFAQVIHLGRVHCGRSVLEPRLQLCRILGLQVQLRSQTGS